MSEIINQNSMPVNLSSEYLTEKEVFLHCGGAAELTRRTTHGKISDSPLVSNRGDISDQSDYTMRVYDEKPLGIMLADRVDVYPLRRGLSDTAFIDAITFTVKESDFIDYCGVYLQNEKDFFIQASYYLHQIFGFGLTKPCSGRYFHKFGYMSGDYKCQYANVYYGHQAKIITFEIKGTGCQAALGGWEVRLYDFLARTKGRISRVDLAKDFFDGEYTPESALNDWRDGKFTRWGASPKGECVGTEWLNDDLSGKTFYVGTRGGARFARIYDKAKQMGDKESFWVRFEIEFRRHKTWVIPLDVLLNMGHYWGGAYPVCEQFEQQSKRIVSKKKQIETVTETIIKRAELMVGKLINFLVDLNWTDASIVSALIDKKGRYPDKLNPEIYFAEECQVTPIHEYDDFNLINT